MLADRYKAEIDINRLKYKYILILTSFNHLYLRLHKCIYADEHAFAYVHTADTMPDFDQGSHRSIWRDLNTAISLCWGKISSFVIKTRNNHSKYIENKERYWRSRHKL